MTTKTLYIEAISGLAQAKIRLVVANKDRAARGMMYGQLRIETDHLLKKQKPPLVGAALDRNQFLTWL